jgi:hypothetical protein
MQVGLDLQPRSAAEACPIDLQILHDPLHVISCFGEGDQFDPVDHVDFWIARIAVTVDPFLHAAAPGIVGGKGHGATIADIDHGRFGKQDFVYLPEEDAYRCPAGEQLPYRFTSEEDGKRIRRYWTMGCQNCSLKSQCTTGARAADSTMGA